VPQHELHAPCPRPRQPVARQAVGVQLAVGGGQAAEGVVGVGVGGGGAGENGDLLRDEARRVVAVGEGGERLAGGAGTVRDGGDVAEQVAGTGLGENGVGDGGEPAVLPVVGEGEGGRGRAVRAPGDGGQAFSQVEGTPDAERRTLNAECCVRRQGGGVQGAGNLKRET